MQHTQDYVVEKWEDVSVSEEFERCCQEIAAGEYVTILSLLSKLPKRSLFVDGAPKVAKPSWRSLDDCGHH
jgi:hypothetical protein